MIHHGNLTITKENAKLYAGIIEVTGDLRISQGASLTAPVLATVNGKPFKVPVLEHIDAKILAAIQSGGGKLEMDAWHTCGTTHCRAGWAIHLCGDEGYALEAITNSETAGTLIYAASRPGLPTPNFRASNKDAWADLHACANASVP